MDRLLPFNASDLEQSLEQVHAQRIETMPLPISSLWHPEQSSEALLPWLAWAFSVDTWSSDWPVENKRAVIQESVLLHRRKGTLAAMNQILGALDVEFTLEEWFQYGGQPHTFRLTTSAYDNWLKGTFLDHHLFNHLKYVVDAVKPVRSHYSTQIKIYAENEIGCGQSCSLFSVLRLTFNFTIQLTTSIGIAAAAWSPIPLLSQRLTLINPAALSLLKPLSVSAPSRLSITPRLKTQAIVTRQELTCDPVTVHTQTTSSMVNVLHCRVAL